MSSNTQHPEVLIAGGGPTGLALALSLARHGVSFRLIDKARGRSTTSRALAIQARTLEMLDLFDLTEPFLKLGNPVKRSQLYEQDHPLLRVDFSSMATAFPYALMLPETETERLFDEILAAENCQVERPIELTGFSQDNEGVRCQLAGPEGSSEIQCRYLVGCDGAHSMVRHTLGLAFAGEEYAQFFALADVQVQPALPVEELQVHLHASGPVIFFPLPGEIVRVVARMNDSCQESGVSLDELEQVVRERAYPQARLENCQWISGFRTHRRKAERFSVGRVFLAGDAAHIHSPAGGQGMNTGIQDAFNLGWKLASTLRGHASPKLLDSYHSERNRTAEHVLAMTDRMMTMSKARPQWVISLRDEILPRISHHEWLQSYAASQLGQLRLNYRPSPITLGHRLSQWHTSCQPGDRAPELTFRDETGANQRLYDLLLPTTFTLLLFLNGHKMGDPDPTAEARSVLRDFQNDFGPQAQAWLVVPPALGSKLQPGKKFLTDVDGLAAGELGLSHGGMALIRPDAYLSALSPGLDWSTFRLGLLDFWTGAGPDAGHV